MPAQCKYLFDFLRQSRAQANKAVHAHSLGVLCHIMRRRGVLISPLFAVSFCVVNCHKKPADIEISAPGADFSPPLPVASAPDAPEFVRSLSLLYPQAEIFRVNNEIVQKSTHAIADIVGYYQKAFAKHGFREVTKLEQVSAALLQYERPGNKITETVSVDIQKLPYTESNLIRISRSEVERTHGQKD